MVDRGDSVTEIASRLGMTTDSLYVRKKKCGPGSAKREEETAIENELRQLTLVAEERRSQKSPRCTSPTSPSEVHLYSSTKQYYSGYQTWPLAGRVSERLLSVVPTIASNAGYCQRTSDEAEQTVMAETWWHLRLPQDP